MSDALAQLATKYGGNAAPAPAQGESNALGALAQKYAQPRVETEVPDQRGDPFDFVREMPDGVTPMRRAADLGPSRVEYASKQDVSRRAKVAAYPYDQILANLRGESRRHAQEKLKEAAQLELQARDAAVLNRTLPRELSRHADDFMFSQGRQDRLGTAMRIKGVAGSIDAGEPVISEEARKLISEAMEIAKVAPEPPPSAEGIGQAAGDIATELVNFALLTKAVPVPKGWSPTARMAGKFAGVEGAKEGLEGAVSGALMGGMMGAGGEVGGIVGEGIGGALGAGVQGGSPKDMAVMGLLPVVLRAPGIMRNKLAGRASRQAIQKHALALEAGKRMLPGGGGRETVFHVAERIANKEGPPSRADLPTVKDQRSRAQIASDVRQAMEAQDRLNKRTDELKKKHKNKKTLQRKLENDPVILAELQKLRDWMTKGEGERVADRDTAAKMASEGWLEFESDLKSELGVRAGVVDALEYANKWGRTKPESQPATEPDLSKPAARQPERSSAPPDLGEGIFTSPGEPRMADPGRKPVHEFTPSEAPQYGPDALRIASVGEIGDIAKKGLSVGKQLVRKYFTQHKGLPSYVAREAQKKENYVGKEMKRVAFLAEDVQRETRRIFKGKAPTEAERSLMNAVLQGKRPWSDIKDQKLRDALYELRSHVDAMSQRFIDEGVVDGELAATIEANKEVYLNRAYRVFDDPKWAEKVHPDIRQDAYDYIKNENPSWNDNQIRQAIGELLFQGKAAQAMGPVDYARAAQLGQKDLSIFKPLKDIPKAIRRLWGEYDDPVENYRRSMFKMANMLGNHRALTEVRNAGMGKLFWTKNDPNIDPDAIAVIAKGDYRMLPLAGLRTFPGVEKSIREFNEPADLGWLLRFYLRGNATVKMGKTVLSPAAQVRNFQSNPLILVANGTFNPARVWDGLKMTWTDFWNAGDATGRAKLERMYELGIIGDSASFGEIKEISKDIGKRGAKAFEEMWEGKRRLRKLPQQVYRAMDDVFRIAEFESKFKQYRKRIPQSEMSDADLEVYIAEMARNTVPTYSLAPEFVKKLRRFPLIGSFPTFFAEIIRTRYHTNKYMAAEMKDPRLRDIAVRRALGQAAAYSAAGVTADAISAFSGARRERREALRTFLAPWDENSNIAIVGRDPEKMEYHFVNLSYTDPFAIGNEAFTAAMRADNPVDAAMGALGELLRPFYSEEILSEALIEVGVNKKDANGAPVFNPELPPERIVEESVKYVLDKIQPGFSADMIREMAAQMGYKDASGVDYPKWVSLAKMLTGVKVQTVNIPNAMMWRTRTFKNKLGQSEQILTSLIHNRGTVSDAEIVAAHREMETARRKLYDEMLLRIKAAQTMGMSNSQIRGILRDEKVSRRMQNSLMGGEYRPYQESSTLLEGAPAHMQSRKGLVKELTRIERGGG
jgi:hypothetical protein